MEGSSPAKQILYVHFYLIAVDIHLGIHGGYWNT